jgi:hypothetical protein
MADVITEKTGEQTLISKKEEPIEEKLTDEKSSEVESSKGMYIRYALIVCAVLLVIYLLHNAYKSFRSNQHENFINHQPRTDTQSDKPNDIMFDMDIEIKKLIKLQEKYLSQIK